jgi:hypothetical protein
MVFQVGSKTVAADWDGFCCAMHWQTSAAAERTSDVELVEQRAAAFVYYRLHEEGQQIVSPVLRIAPITKCMDPTLAFWGSIDARPRGGNKQTANRFYSSNVCVLKF